MMTKARRAWSLGIFGEPSPSRVDELVVAFLRRHRDLSVRLVGRNSSVVAERVRRGELGAGLVLLPIDDHKVDVRPIACDEVLYVSASSERTRQPATIERLAQTPLVFYDAESAERPDTPATYRARPGSRIRLQPKVEVELNDMALPLVAAGSGIRICPAPTRGRLTTEGFEHRLVQPRAL